MLNCKEATALMSMGMDEKLSLSQKLGLRLHLLICTGCQNCRKQMAFLREGCLKFMDGENRSR